MLKNITLSAEEKLIHEAREKAQREHTTLNASFRQWLNQYVGAHLRESEYEALMNTLAYAKPGRKFTREQMNAR
jgi:hypothetical protein